MSTRTALVVGGDGLAQQAQAADTVAVPGAFSVAGTSVFGGALVSGSYTLRIQATGGGPAPGSTGLGVSFYTSSGSAQMVAYDFTKGAYGPMLIGASGVTISQGLATTASAANVTIDANGNLLKSSSSQAYKTDIEDMDPALVDRVLRALRPVWYRSTAPADPSGWSFWGLIAEEVAAIDPRLVHWGYQDDQFETVIVHEAVPATDDEPAIPAMIERRVRAGEQLRPDGVQYERIAALLLSGFQRIDQRLAAIEANTAR